MTTRLKLVLPQLIGPFQSSFVPGRQITYNILIYNEVLHSMKEKQGAVLGLMAVKIDLEKAYDRLSWDFIKDTIMEVGIHQTWTRNLMHGIESSRLSILWDGTQFDWFTPERGIRQDDPISSNIFVMCVELLSHIICKAIVDGDWKGIKLSQHGLTLTDRCESY